jgi:hypothetical protein
VTAAATAAFWLTFQPNASWDALQHAVSIREQSFPLLVDPHHPLGTLLAAAAHAAATEFGWAALDPLAALRLCAAICAGATLGLLFAVLRRSGVALPVALGCTLGLGGSWAFWHEASAGSIYPASALVLLVACTAFLFSSSPWVVGALSALAILGHQQNALLVPFVALAYGSPAGKRRAGIYIMACGATLAAAYLCLWLASERSDPLPWVTGYVGKGFHFRGGGVIDTAVASLVGMGVEWPPAVRAALGALLVLGGGIWLAAAARHSALARATLALAAAALWWEPQTTKYWVAVLVCGWLTVGLLGRRAPRILGPAILIAGLATAVVNVERAVERSRDDSAETAARRIAAATTAEDLLVVGTDLLGPSLRYHGERPHATNVFAVWYRATGAGEEGSTALRRLAAETRARGGRVFVASNALDVGPDHREQARLPAFGSDPQELFPAAPLAAVLRYELPRGRERTLYEVLPAR